MVASTRLILGYIKEIKYSKNNVLKTKSNYEYDNMNQLTIEDVYDSTVSCSSVKDTCYSRMYYYDKTGNLTATKTFKYGERDYITEPEQTSLKPYVTGDDIVVSSSNCSIYGTNTLNIGAAEPTCSFNYYKDYSYPPIILNLTTTKLSSDVDTSAPGFYMQEYKGSGSGYTVYIGIVFKVGNPVTTVENTPIKSITYNYENSNWDDQLKSYTILDDGITTTSVITYDNQGNPTKITNFRYNGTNYNHASLKFSGRTLDEIKIYNNSTETTQDLIATISYTYNDQGYRTSKTVNDETIYYTLSGDKVIYETNGEYEIIYTYDVDGTLISFYYDNDITVKKDGNDYFYIKDLQGNISKIVDENGNIVVEYVYECAKQSLVISKGASPLLVKFSQQLITVVLHV